MKTGKLKNILVREHENKYFVSVFLCFLVFMISCSFASAAELTQVSVPVNPYNTLASQLTDKENGLNARELALNNLQQKLEQGYRQVFLVMGVLFLLIVINFLLDVRRRKKTADNPSLRDKMSVNKIIDQLKI
jgi:hypothetical protein